MKPSGKDEAIKCILEMENHRIIDLMSSGCRWKRSGLEFISRSKEKSFRVKVSLLIQTSVSNMSVTNSLLILG